MKSPLTLDFETKGIEPRPAYPPKPVGVALRHSSGRREYLAFGHPTKNNCTEREAKTRVAKAIKEHGSVLMHEAKFDCDVMHEAWGMSWPKKREDTKLLAFFDDPRAATHSLKPLAERHLGEPPEERDELFAWIRANVRTADGKPVKEGKEGAYISEAPGDLVGRYAIGDVDRTWGLRQKWQKSILGDKRFREAYDRELACTEMLVRMEGRGVPVDVKKLKKDIPRFETIERELRNELLGMMKVPAKLREEFPMSGARFVEYLEASRLFGDLPKTAKGNPSTSADVLAPLATTKRSKRALELLETAAQVRTCINTFMKSWLSMAEANDGRFFARYNQVRGDDVGARTGRLSMTPNLQNVIRSDKGDLVPKLRDYIIPPDGHVLFQRDYAQQELRILAHYEDGPLLQMYIDDPTVDAHTAAQTLIRQQTGLAIERRQVKDIGFGLLYGMGGDKLARKLGVDTKTARTLKAAYLQALPGVKELIKELTACADNNEPIWTWGGRRYYCEPPRIVDGRWRSFQYKMLNILIQGSAADCTKHAMVDYMTSGADDEFPLMLQVHDEMLGYCKPRQLKAAHIALDRSMRSSQFAVTMLSEGKAGAKSWHQMTKYKEV